MSGIQEGWAGAGAQIMCSVSSDKRGKMCEEKEVECTIRTKPLHLCRVMPCLAIDIEIHDMT